MCRQSLVCKFVQSAPSKILFDLAVASIVVELKEPGTESGQFRRRKLSHFLFDISTLLMEPSYFLSLAELDARANVSEGDIAAGKKAKGN
jgi:hypothetical protein